jgi:hypothetical protein
MAISSSMTESDFIASVTCNRTNRAILERLDTLALPDAWLVSGALFQTVWNTKTGRPPQYGIKDYDIFYFDPDTSWEAEDRVIKRVGTALADLGAPVEVRNQARVHLWYEQKFGLSYPPLSCASDGIDRFLMCNAQVGLRPNGGGYAAYAPHGFDDVFKMVVRPNRTANFHSGRYMDKALRWKALWPELTVLPD